MSISRTLAAISLSALSALGLATSAAALTIEPVAEGLEGPWGVAPLPTGGLLGTEKAGRVILSRAGCST